MVGISDLNLGTILGRLRVTVYHLAADGCKLSRVVVHYFLQVGPDAGWNGETNLCERNLGNK